MIAAELQVAMSLTEVTSIGDPRSRIIAKESRG